MSPLKNSRFIRHCLNTALLLALAALSLSRLHAAEAQCPSAIPTLANDWGDIQKRMVADATARANEIQIVFAGDSISARWTSGAGRAIWAERYAPLGAINFSISSDRTSNLLWRLQNGALKPLHPKMVIMLIGANNLDSSPEAVAYGVWANVAYIRKALPNTRVLVQGIFRRENPPSMADKAPKVNALLARLDDGKMVKFIDFSSKLVKPDGTLDRNVFPDGCHPEKPEGFQIWADSIQPVIDEWMKTPPIANVPPPPSPVGEPADTSCGQPEERNDFLSAHKRFMARKDQEKCELLFLGVGTSMACWDRVQELTKKEYGPHWILNVAGRTENILWKLTNGELDGMHPKLVVLQVQENVYDNNTPAQDVATGVEAITKLIQEKLPETKLLLIGAFPKGTKPEDPLRVKMAEYNTSISKLADGKSVHYLDLGKAFLAPDGTLGPVPIPGMFPYSPQSYELWADAQRATILELMGKTGAAQ